MKRQTLTPAMLLGSLVLFAACSDNNNRYQPPPDPIAVGQEVFRFETFGNEAFWTDAMQLPQGIIEAGLTPLQAIGVGLNVNAEALEPTFAGIVVDQINTALAGGDAPALSDPAVTLELIRQGAVIGVVPFGADGKRLPLGSDPAFGADDQIAKVGVACALCHARTDDSILATGEVGPGSVGVQVDGITAEGLDVGAIFATAQNPLAYLPFLQLAYDALDGASLGRGGHPGINSDDTIEQQTADARAYLTGMNMETGLRHYPLSSFDPTPDGIGNATYIPPFFRTDLAAPWGSSGAFEQLEDFNNLVYTVALDPTSLLTDEGRALLNVLAGPVGDEIAARYEQVLRDTGVIPMGMAVSDVLPYVEVAQDDLPAGSASGPVGRRVDEAKLAALSAYTDQLQAPAAPMGLNATQVALGEQLFSTPRDMGGAGCVGCHKADPGEPVENDRIRPITSLYRAYEDDLLVLLDRSMQGLSPLQTTLAGPSPEYDLALVVLDATRRGQEGFGRGFAKPMLLALDSKTEFLHNGSVAGETSAEGLNLLLDPARGTNAPHGFFYPAVGEPDDPAGRAALVDYLRSRTTP